MKQEIIAFQRYVARVHDEMSHDVLISYFVYAGFFTESTQYFGRALKLLKSMYGMTNSGKLFTLFHENTFRSTLYDSQRCRVHFIGRKGLNGSVEFIRYSYVTSDSTSDIISTQNIFVHSWGKYPTMIGPTCSNYTCRAYVPITFQEGFNKICEHERRRLLFVECERIAFQRHLATVRDEMSHDVALNYFVPPVNNALGMNSYFNSPRPSFPNKIEFRDDWTFC